MSISGQNISIVIVTLKSEHVIHRCLESIGKDIPIIVIENSNNSNFKSDLEAKYQNVKCVISKENLGMGAGNNLGIKLAKTNYVLILNPDVTLESNTLNELFLASKKIKDFSILSPLSANSQSPNYNYATPKKRIDIKNEEPFRVEYVDGFAMLFNKENFKDENFFDENFFLFLENHDLCKRVIEKGENIYIAPKAKINHAGGKAINEKFNEEIEFCRNWHWMWSRFYFNKKHFGIVKAIGNGFLSYLSSIFKILFYLLIKNKFKKNIYFNRASGFYNALLGRRSWQRPNLED